MTRRSERPIDPMGTLPMFEVTTDGAGVTTVAAGGFRCGLCNALGTDTPGDLCPTCTEPAKPARKPRKTTARAAGSTRKGR